MSAPGRVTAVLGPTNTGKTHLAVERMLGHASGMIGCPLRLLAREIYDKVAALRGKAAVALVTGEEKILPRRPHYYVCTVESMPRDETVEFVAVDEVQLAADPERGHVFTDRLLHARGLSETMFLGAATIAPLIRRLVPEAEFVSRPRFSRLLYAGERKITRLKPRSAVVAFSAADVYALAEAFRRLRGGAAVVLGALSPRTRNAQVAMFQAGEVDYLVATDAIGMGLNLQVDHVAFAELRKFDGRAPRPLTAAEIAQIAGRAGRHMQNGSFGTTADAGPLAPGIVSSVEAHEFAPLTQICWRNARLDFGSLKGLLKSLEQPPPVAELVRPREAEDLTSLRALAAKPEIAGLAVGPEAVRLLWEVSSIPDFRKILTDAHVGLLARLYLHLAGPAASLPEDWINRMVDCLDRSEGDIDSLSSRIAHIRTWNYIAHRPGWVADAKGLRDRARAIEDRLSDALHERLTECFVDRRTAALVRGLSEHKDIAAVVRTNGDVVVEGEPVGRLRGLRFEPDDIGAWREAKALRGVVRRALAPIIARRVNTLVHADDSAFALGPDGRLAWQGAPIGRLTAGPAPLAPKVEVPAGDLIDGTGRDRVRLRLECWIGDHIARELAPLFRAREAALAAPARGTVFHLVEGLGSVRRAAVAALLDSLRAEDRKALARLGIRLGCLSVFMPALLKARPTALRAQLWSIHKRALRDPLPPGRVSLPADDGLTDQFYLAVGYQRVGPLAIRVDILERLAAKIRKSARAGAFAADSEWLALAGASPDDFAGVLGALGYQARLPTTGDAQPKAGDILYVARHGKRRRAHAKPRRAGTGRARIESPFAALQALDLRGK